jgi:N,N'-diacetyllegionaminate synthase
VKNKKITIIAEAGINHNNKKTYVKSLINSAKKVGSDYIKFQSYITENLVLKNTDKANYQKKNTSFNTDQFEMLKKYELSPEMYNFIYHECKKIKIKVLFSVFDIESFYYLKKKFKINIVKLGSGEITNYSLLNVIAKSKVNVILSTGMASEKEIINAVNYLRKNKLKNHKISILHCTSEYPANVNNLNLMFIKKLKKIFKKNIIGYSDHTDNINTPSLAITLGAQIIEKHFTLSKKLSGPDHKASLNISQFKKMIELINYTKKSLGSYSKKISSSEKKTSKLVRKSIYANEIIKKGNLLTEKNIISLRPEKEIKASNWDNFLKSKAKKNYKKYDKI